VAHHGEQSFVHALVKLFADYRDHFAAFLRQIVFDGPMSLQRSVDVVVAEA